MIARRIKPILLAAVATAALSAGASAGNLPAGSGPIAVPSGLNTLLTGDTFLNSIAGSYQAKDGLGNVVFTGKYEQDVFRNLGGTIDFLTEVSVDPMQMEGATDVTLRDFTGFDTDVHWLSPDTIVDPAGITTDVAPSTMSRLFVGDSVHFSFPGGIDSATDTNDLLIRTDAVNYGPGSIVVQDGGNARLVAFAPASAVPEPGSLALLATGGLPLLGFLRRRIRTA